ncbi:MAG: hypothetical protein ACTSQ7_08330 [Alphaproteobacteria bacterium]
MPPITLAAARKTLSSALYLGLCLATIAHFVIGAPADLRPVGALLLVFLLLEVWATSRMILASAAVLVALGLLAQDGGMAALLIEAGARTLPFLVLFLAVLCLQGPALASPALRAIGGFVAAQPPGRRFAGMALAGHLLGAVLNVAGLLLVLSLRDSKLASRDQMRLTAGAMRGFGAAAAWSPLFVAMSVVLAALPSLSWLEIAWRSGLVAASILLFAWIWNRIERGRGGGTVPGVPAARLAPGTLARAALILAALFVPVIWLFEVYGLAIPIALGLVAPAMSGLWQASQAPAGARAVAATRRGRDVFQNLPGLRNEALLFFAANTFGLGLSTALDPVLLARLSAVLPGAGLSIPILIMGGLLIAGLGVHPIVIVVAVGTVLSPELLHLSDMETALALLVVWGMGAIMSPFSGTVLQVARLSNCSPFRVAWIWNARFSLAIGLPVSAVVYAVARLL